MKTALLLSALVALAGCATPGFYVPAEQTEGRDQRPDLVETGSLIPTGEKQIVRDSTQPVDVYSDKELEADRPANTRDAVNRALRGR